MRTRRGVCYPTVHGSCSSETNLFNKRKDFAAQRIFSRKRSKLSPAIRSGSDGPDLFDSLPDDLVICILSKLSSSAACPSDFLSVLITYGFVDLYYFILFLFFREIIVDVDDAIDENSITLRKNSYIFS